ncbi:MAG: precorrin-3B C(17)-methyltransferase [Alphaproteobacteria bacterium]|nr:MAG: precorrin-3B C(17)-methyltransferase [Alphaproteobacteria bacterium]
MSALPPGVAVVVLGPSGATLARRVRDLLPDARLHGPRAHPGDWDESYERLVPHLAALFAASTPVIGLCASGILIRAVAPLLGDKHIEPPVVALAEDGSVAVPLLGGHHGANALARALAEALGCHAAITTAGDLRLGFALDEPPPGWRIANPERIKPVAAALLAGRPVALVEEACRAGWLRAGSARWAERADLRIIVTDRAMPADSDALVFAVAAVVSVDLKVDEPGIQALAASLGVPARFFPAARLLDETARLTVRSEAAFRATGCWGVAEGAALATAGPGGALIMRRRQSRRATCAIARAPMPLDAAVIGRPRGRLAIIGIGPGDPGWRTPEASALLAASDDVVGYRLYLDLLSRALVGKCRHDSEIGAERNRVRLALDLAAEGRAVALVSSGDAGIYGLAALVFETIDREQRRDWSAVEIAVTPGISAMQAAAARAGAPLGHDFCAISLSDLLTPWPAVRARIEAAASADFVVALYNPRSARRATQLAEAAAILLEHRPPETPVFIARNLGRSGETHRVMRLGELADAEPDMLSLVLIGNRQTRIIPGDPPRLYTPRGYFDVDGR